MEMPEGQSVVRPVTVVGGGGAPAVWCGVNVLEGAVPEVGASGGAAVMTWSGWFGGDPFGRDPRAWMAGGYERLASRLRAATERLEMTGGKWLFRPHARHVLHDAQRCARFVEEFGGARFGLALDPVSMLEASMLGDAEDHVSRVLQRLGGVADCVVVPEGGVRVIGEGDEERVVCAPDGATGTGGAVLEAWVVRGLVDQWAAGARVVTVPGWA